MSNEKGPSFADLFAAEEMPQGRSRRFSVGDAVEGVVAHITADAVFVDLDAKQSGLFEKHALLDHEGNLRVKVGDTIKGQVVAIEGASQQIKLGTSLGKDAGVEQLAAAHEQGLPVEGTITGVNKGGAEVQVAGLRGFCPVRKTGGRTSRSTRGA